jgi:hypothetical protein
MSVKEQLTQLVERYFDKPVLFVEELLGANPDYWQAEVLRSVVTNDNIAIRSGHGVGKSAFLAWTILWWLMTRHPAKVACTAPTAHQLEDVLWGELAKWHRKLPDLMQRVLSMKSSRLDLSGSPNESFAVARTARKEKPEAFQGFHSDNMLFIADEASGIENVIFEVGEGAMSTPGAKTILTGNPTRNDGYFHAAFHKNRSLWEVFQVSCQNSKNVDPSYIEEMKTKYGEDSDIYRVRVLGEFPAASSLQFIHSDLVEEAQEREEQCLLHDPMILGVDVARFGDDQSIIFPRRGRDARTFPLQKYRNLDTMQLAARVAEAVREYKPDAVFVDGGGVGGGVVDRLNQLSIDCIEVNFGSKADEGRYANKRAEMWGRMKEWLEGITDAEQRQPASGPTR